VVSPAYSTGTAELLQQLEALVSPLGVMENVCERRLPRGLTRVTGYLSMLGSGVPGRGVSVRAKSIVTASGHAIDDADSARLVAMAEAAERYAGLNPVPDTVLSTAGGLDGAVLDLERIPRLSEREIAAGGPLRPFDAAAAMRWVRGVDLSSGVLTWIPAVMAHYGIGELLSSERFWYQISTGFAVHSDPVEAVVRGICEVVERDVIAVTWLQKLALPPVAQSQLSAAAQYLLDWGDRHFVSTYLFDATSDIGVPTVYCLQVAPYDEATRHVVGCGTGRTLATAAEKSLLEAIGTRSAYYPDGEPPEDFSQFRRITDGARYMAKPERSAAFDFLVRGAQQRTAPERQALPDDSGEALTWLVDSLSRSGMQAIAVACTPPEVAAAGLTAVSVVIPDLQPMTLLPLAQFRAHPRLYSAPTLMGYASVTEEELNPWPQPFA
jgi:ribosomal protein S12 methylthiotransferase accessory factor